LNDAVKDVRSRLDRLDIDQHGAGLMSLRRITEMVHKLAAEVIVN
jgi:hypothetical protein